MARIRTLKPDIWQDESLGRVPLGARLLYIGLITQADDEGRLRAAAALLRSTIFPYDERVTVRNVQEWLDALVMERRVRTYTVDGEVYADLPSWPKHQKINRPVPSSIPSFMQHDKSRPVAGDSWSPHGGLTEDSSSLPHGGLTEDSLREGKGRDKSTRDKPPSPSPSLGLSRTLVDRAAKSWPGEDGEVWTVYAEFHPASQPTQRRRALLHRRRQEGFSQEVLVAAVRGNHADAWCNGENPNGRQYHGWELIFRDAGQVEKYAAYAVNGKAERTPEEEAELERMWQEYREEPQP